MPAPKPIRTKSVRTPRTLVSAKRRLGDLGSLATVTEWERALIVACFVRLNDEPGRPGIDSSVYYSPYSFAELGIVGLRSHVTVRRYVQIWLDQHDGEYPEPGRSYQLPEVEFPSEAGGTAPPTGGRPRASQREIVERAKKDPVYAQELATELVEAAPRVLAKAVRKNPAAHRAFIEAANPPGDLPRDRSSLPVSELERLLVELGAQSYAYTARQFDQAVHDRHHEGNPWRPNEVEAVLRYAQEGVQHGRNVIDLMTPVTDEDLAEFIGKEEGSNG